MNLTEFLDQHGGNRVVCHRQVHRQRVTRNRDRHDWWRGQVTLYAGKGFLARRGPLETNILTDCPEERCASVTDLRDETAAILTLNLLHVPRRGHGQDLVRVRFDSTLRDDRSHSGRHSEGALLRV